MKGLRTRPEHFSLLVAACLQCLEVSMPCVRLKNGARIYFSDEAFQDKDYMKVVAEEISEEEPKILLSSEKEERFKELRKFIGYLKKGEVPKNITILED